MGVSPHIVCAHSLTLTKGTEQLSHFPATKH